MVPTSTWYPTGIAMVGLRCTSPATAGFPSSQLPAKPSPLPSLPKSARRLPPSRPARPVPAICPAKSKRTARKPTSLSEKTVPVPSEGRSTLLLNAVRAAAPWAIALAAALLALAVAAWLAWRLLLATPRDPPSTYRRLRRLGRFASLSPAQHQTPHQWAATVSNAIPEHHLDVRRIVDAYALRTYAGRLDADPVEGNHVADAWNTVRFPLLWYGLRRRDA